jgi:hypothetical protein
MNEILLAAKAQKKAASFSGVFSPETPIYKLGFSLRSFNALSKSGCDTAAKVLSLDEKALESIKNLGKKSIKEIRIIQKQMQEQTKTAANRRHKNAFDCRFVYTWDTIYPADYIGVLDISIEAHNVLYNAGVFPPVNCSAWKEKLSVISQIPHKKSQKNSLPLSQKKSPLWARF